MAVYGKMTVKDELGKVWKNTNVVYFKVVSQYFPGGTAENHIGPQSQDGQSLGQELRPGPPKHEARVLTIQLQCSVVNVISHTLGNQRLTKKW
jgi:hypothetical protein